MIEKYSYILFIPLISVLFLSFLLISQVYAERGLKITSSVNTERCIALITGNSAYKSSPFDDELKRGGIGLFYFTGYGVQTERKNYLNPVGSNIEREDEIQDEAINVGSVLRKEVLSGGKRSSDARYTDNGDGTISDSNNGLMWTKKDSWADTGHCMDWNKSKSYVSNLTTGGYRDWRLPTVAELKNIYEMSKSNNMGGNFRHCRSEYPLHIDSIFADGAAYWYWSSETSGSCCARSVAFDAGHVIRGLRSTCYGLGVRALRR